MDETIEVPGQPARNFLGSDKYCQEPALEARQTINGIYLAQTVDWFLEFAPRMKHDKKYRDEFVSSHSRHLDHFLVTFHRRELTLRTVGSGPRRDWH